ncbi:type II toxin-antitoxin system RelE/ParE family toxin [Mucilaginibacter galii]|uniref:Toxin RelE n=1 Tax=Mucilaginibacter galii TaxID=2005073 RepID=A0A917N388_9SPHI|nr:type II toxin-antitoxin system RelE/ParE family toxin [Mucilaginibacter galii]GGI50857.1 toxin RelE [Mucilaginibacter galii]
MIVLIDKTFEKDVSKINNKALRAGIKSLILNLQQADLLTQINNIKKLTGYKEFYRVRIGNYRIGIRYTDDNITLIRCLHRKDIYQVWP